MSRAVQTSGQLKGKREIVNFGQIRRQFDEFMTKSHPGVEVAVKTVFGALQGGGLGYFMGALMQSSAQSLKENGGGVNPMMAQMGGNMSPLAQAKGLAALCGVSSGLSVILKKLRNGKEDVWTQMASAAGGGAAFTIANGNYSIPAIVNSALVLGIFTGGITKVMESFKPQHEEKDFERSKFLLSSLGLSKYDRNLKKGQLTDNTIMLWTESALREVKIPPGPRLLILHHIDQLRQWQKTEGSRPTRTKPSEISPTPQSPELTYPAPQQETQKPH